MEQLVNLISTGPARQFGIYPEKGSLKENTDADIVIFNPEEEWVLSKETIHSASGYTAYEGKKVIGKAVRTYLRGNLIMKEGEYFGKPGEGKFIEEKC